MFCAEQNHMRHNGYSSHKLYGQLPCHVAICHDATCHVTTPRNRSRRSEHTCSPCERQGPRRWWPWWARGHRSPTRGGASTSGTGELFKEGPVWQSVCHDLLAVSYHILYMCYMVLYTEIVKMHSSSIITCCARGLSCKISKSCYTPPVSKGYQAKKTEDMDLGALAAALKAMEILQQMTLP